jgi:hypothetical protein
VTAARFGGLSKQEKQMKTSELTGTALDWAVATAEGMSWRTPENTNWSPHAGDTNWVMDKDGALKRFYFDGSRSRAGHWEVNETFTPSTDWSQGGPIIEREGITLLALDADWEAQHSGTPCWAMDGPTPLIAAMRCFVASKLGDEIDIPAELM